MHSLQSFTRERTTFLSQTIERLHSFPSDQLNKNHGGHVGVPDKSLIKIILNWNTNMAAVTSCANALFIIFPATVARHISQACPVWIYSTLRVTSQRALFIFHNRDESELLTFQNPLSVMTYLQCTKLNLLSYVQPKKKNYTQL
jgi:hypothetical protein